MLLWLHHPLPCRTNHNLETLKKENSVSKFYAVLKRAHFLLLNLQLPSAMVWTCLPKFTCWKFNLNSVEEMMRSWRLCLHEWLKTLREWVRPYKGWVCPLSCSLSPPCDTFHHVMMQQGDPHQKQSLDLGLLNLQNREPNKLLFIINYPVCGILF